MFLQLPKTLTIRFCNCTFLQFKESFEMKILKMFIKGVTHFDETFIELKTYRELETSYVKGTNFCRPNFRGIYFRNSQFNLRI